MLQYVVAHGEVICAGRGSWGTDVVAQGLVTWSLKGK
jgi:hypothetical protein